MGSSLVQFSQYEHRIPLNGEIEITVEGKGEAIAQVVKRFNLPEAEEGEEILKISVDYDVTQVEVNDLVRVSVELEFALPLPMEAGMVVLDVSVPTGFAPITESITEVVEKEEKIKRYEVAGRKVIFYIENMLPGDKISFSFNVKAMYPVKAKSASHRNMLLAHSSSSACLLFLNALISWSSFFSLLAFALCLGLFFWFYALSSIIAGSTTIVEPSVQTARA